MPFQLYGEVTELATFNRINKGRLMDLFRVFRASKGLGHNDGWMELACINVQDAIMQY